MEVPIACTRTEPEMRERRRTLLDSLRASALAILSPQGQVTYLSYLGGDQSVASGVTLDAAGNVYVTVQGHQAARDAPSKR